MKNILVLAALLTVAHAQAGPLEDSGVKGGLVVVVGCGASSSKIMVQTALAFAIIVTEPPGEQSPDQELTV